MYFSSFLPPPVTHAATNIYYSVGQNTSDHKTGTPTVTISSGVATFSVPQTATNMGVGDAVTYGGSTVYITGKQSTSVWTVETATGTVPVATTSAVVTSIAHAFSSLNAAIGGSSPGASGVSYLNTKNLTSGSGYILNIPCYYDSGADTSAVLMAASGSTGWTTATTTYINIYTATSTLTQVNQNQRSSGVWSNTKYNLSVTDNYAIDVNNINYIRIDGLQMQVISQTASRSILGSSSGPTAGNNDIRISNNILQGNGNGSFIENGISIAANAVDRIWNNVLYNLPFTGDRGFSLNGATSYLYNNTVYSVSTCYRQTAGTVVAINNIAQGCVSAGWVGTFDVSSGYNVSNKADSPGSNNKNSATVAFVSTSTNDFLLSSSDTTAKDSGTNLSADANLAFTNDILGNIRPYNTTWDIGANEFAPTYTIGATISGLTGSITLEDNGADDYATSTNGSFTFATPIASGSTYAVSVSSQPAGQTCAVTNGSGTATSTNITNVSVSCVTADTTPPSPGASGAITTTNVSYTSLTLNWTKATDNVSTQSALQYRVYESTSNNMDTVSNIEANGTPLNTYTTDISTLDVSGLAANTTYYFNVIVKDEAGNKAAYTAKSQATLTDTTGPTPGNSGTVAPSSVTGHTLTLNWTKATDNVSAQTNLQYEVVKSTSNNVDTVTNAETNGTVIQAFTNDINTLAVTGLSSNTTYYFNVVVKDEAGNKTAYAMQSQATPAVIYYVDNTNGSASNSNAGTSPSLPWLTISKCASMMQAGDTCMVEPGGSYDERVTQTTSGTASAKITYEAVSGSPQPKVRAFTITNADYITVKGFEITDNGMTYDTLTNVLVSSTTGLAILNNTFLDTIYTCISVRGSVSTTIDGNTASYCQETNVVDGTTVGPFTITAGVNDQMKYSVQGVSYTATLTAGSRTLSQVCTDINAVTPGVCDSVGDYGNVALLSTTTGSTSNIAIQSVANNAYTTLGLIVGAGHMEGFNQFFGGGSLSTSNQDSGLLIQNNTVSHVGDYVVTNDTKVVVRNNTWGPSDQVNSDHIDGIQTGNTPGASYVLYEGNVSTDNYNYDNHMALFQGLDNNEILRYNTLFHAAASVDCTRQGNQTGPGVYFYNNTHDGKPSGATTYFGQSEYRSGLNCASGHPASANNHALNNIWYDSSDVGESNPYVYDIATSTSRDYDLWFAGTGNPVETHAVNADPLFTNESTGNFNLQSSSPAIDAGGPLATTSSSGSSSTSLQVNDASYFQDGWAGVNPDCIAVGTSSNTACISSINYSTNVITLATPLSWSAADSVYLYKNSSGTQVLYGSAPDIGAFEYTPTYTIGGTLSGLSGTVVLENKGTDDLTLSSDGSFTFATATSTGGTYSVTVLTQPSNQTCSVSSGSGTVASSNITSVSVTCTTNPVSVVSTPAASNGAPVASVTGTIQTPAAYYASLHTDTASLTTQLSDLQSLLASLLHQVQAKGISLSGLPASPSSFTENLSLGSRSSEVQALQAYLNSHGFPVSDIPGGPGSSSHETTFFGPATRAALIKYQKAHHISPGTGYFGAVTRGVMGRNN